MLGAGNYDKEHDVAHELTGAKSSILIVINGKNGHGLSCKMTTEDLRTLPETLMMVAKSIKSELAEDLKQIEAIKKGEQHAKSTTEDSGPQSFAG